MTVGTICNHNVASIRSGADIIEAARQMREEHVGDLIVIESREGMTVPVGVITDRDIVVEIVAKAIDPSDVTVADAMSRELLSVHEDNGIEYALREMQRVGVRRVPVVDQKGGLTGVLAVDDVLEHLALELTRIAGAIRVEREVEIQSRP